MNQEYFERSAFLNRLWNRFCLWFEISGIILFMRKLIIAIALLLGIYFIIARFAEVQAILETLQRGDLRFIFLALILEFAWLFITAASFKFIYRALGVEERLRNLALMSAAANFVNVVAPSVGMGGMAVFISEARRRSYSAARVTIAGVLYIFFEYVGVLTVLAFGLFTLFQGNHLTSAELVASAILAAIASGLAVLIVLGMRSGAELEKVLAWGARGINRLLFPLLKRDYLSVERAHEFAYDAADGLRQLRHEPQSLALPVILSLSSKAVLMVILWMMFLAFKVPAALDTLVAGFSMGYLFMIVSPTPAGIGFVEGAMTLALSSQGVPLGAAAVLALAYRGITFWVPLFLGMVAFRFLSHQDLPKARQSSPVGRSTTTSGLDKGSS